MAEREKKTEPKPKAGGGKKRLHLHEIRSVQAHDGSIVHHHTFKESPDHDFTMPERGPMATSTTPEEAGQHVSEMFGMNQMAGAGGPGGPEPGGEEPGAAPGGPAGAGPEEAA